MKLLKTLSLALVLLSSTAQAEEQFIQVPGEAWGVHLSAPKLDSSPRAGSSVYLGKADRLQVSLFVEAPRCAGGDSNEKIYECFAASLKRNPVVRWETERANTRPKGGVLVMYMSQAEADGKAISAFNVNVLLAKNGKWVDLHASIASPTREDMASLLAVADSMTIETNTPGNEEALKK